MFSKETLKVLAAMHQRRNAERSSAGRAEDREERQAHEAYCTARTSTEPVGREDACSWAHDQCL